MTLTEKAWFDFIILIFIAANCITLAMERPNIPPWSTERQILDICNNVFTVVFTIEMAFKAVSTGLIYGENAYFKSGNCPSFLKEIMKPLHNFGVFSRLEHHGR